MGANLLHYRPWRGTFRGPAWSVWPIARVAVAMIFRRKLFWTVYGLGLVIFLFFFFGQYLLEWAQDQMGEDRVLVGPFRARPGEMIRLLKDRFHLNGSAATFSNFFWYQGYIVMVVLALAGSIFVGNDFQFGSLPFYLSKPLSSKHYLLGKCLAVAVFVNMMTTLPAAALFVQYGLLTSEEYFVPHFSLLLGILGYGLVLTLTLSLLLVATATWLRRTVPLIMVWTAVLFFCRLLANTLVALREYAPNWRLIDLWNDMYLLGCYCLGMEHNKIPSGPHPAFLEAALVLGALCTLCLTYLILRIRAVEVVR
jgi:ABC-type transport system involved in multi-copper enzyme maturation permease subunit